MTRSAITRSLALTLTLAFAATPTAHAQRAHRHPSADDTSASSDEGDESTSHEHVATGGVARRTGFELELHGTAIVHAGSPLQLRGVAYEVVGFATLRPMPRAHVTVWEIVNGEPTAQPLAQLVADANGRFAVTTTPANSIAIDVGDAQTHRRFDFTVTIREPQRLELLTDRILYEPGETVHAWVRLTDLVSASALSGTPVEITIGGDASATSRLGSSRTRTSAAGVTTLDVAIPPNAPDGSLAVQARTIDGFATSASTVIRIGRRTLERLMAEPVVDQRVVAPGARVTGHVTVRTPSGSPVHAARVEIRISDGAPPLVVNTDAMGVANFTLSAPAYLATPVATQSLDIRIVHRAYGSVRTAASFTLARVPYVVEAVAASGGLVPELDSNLYVTLADPVGAPPREGTEVTLRGPGTPASGLQGRTDVHGIVAFAVRLPNGAAAMHTAGSCAERVAASFDVEVASTVPVSAHVCIPVTRDAMVLPHAIAPIVAPGQRLEFTLERRPAAGQRAIAVDLLHRGEDSALTVLASTVVPRGETRAALNVPAHTLGVLFVRARPIEANASAEGTGGFDVVLARPAHAFALGIEPERAQYHVRETARVLLHTPVGIENGHVALVARDLAAHAGEQPFELAWLRGELATSVADPNTPQAERLLRVSLAAFASADPIAVHAPPLAPSVDDPDEETGSYDESSAAARGDLRDPFGLRDELLRRGIGELMTGLEGLVESATETPAHGVFTGGARRDFDPAVVHTWSEQGGSAPETLGGGEVTLAMLQAVEPTFTFDRVARRVARKRLVQLLATLAAFVESRSGGRSAAEGEPAERWLSRMVQRGVISAGALRDPWGGTFALRRVAAGREAVAIAARASGWELASPGPDHVFGTADDVRNPFERIVPEGTTYAITSGEDRLMRALSALDPGNDVLDRVAAAYGRVGAAEFEEESGVDVTSATTSEALAGGGAGAGRGVRARGAPMGGEPEEPMDSLGAAAQSAPAAPAGHADDRERGLERADAEGQPRRAPREVENRAAHVGPRVAQLAALVRERFPATLRFIADVALDPSGTTRVELPIADALTTYRVEAIAWTGEGWTASAGTEVHVDQDAVVDAPVPPYVVQGDAVRLPLRISNRSQHPIDARVSLSAEGDLHLDLPGPSDAVTIAPGDARDVTVTVRARGVGRGSLVVTAVDARSGQPLDAARRPMEVLADARPVRMAADGLVDGHGTLTFDVPANATYRADGGVRITVGEAIFGDPSVWGLSQVDPTWPAWAIAMGGHVPPHELIDRIVDRYVRAGSNLDAFGYDAAEIARGVSGAWLRDTVPDASLQHALEALTRRLEGYERMPHELLTSAPARMLFARDHTATLLGLAPAVRFADRRPALRDALRRLASRLGRSVEANTAAADDDPAVFAAAAAALGLTESTPSPRALEFLRRASRGFVQSADEAFLESGEGDPLARIAPSSLYALAVVSTGDRITAFAVARTLARMARGSGRWTLQARSLATALLERLTPDRAPDVRGTVRVVIDGHATDAPLEHGVASASSRTLSLPGRHTVEVSLPAGTTLIAEAEARYGRPWTDVPAARAPLAMTLDGPIGSRDGRAALVLRVQNRGPRVIASPVVEIDLPAGAEIDEDARREIQRRVAHAPVITERTLVLTLRAMAPGGATRIPLPIRWSVGGSLHGLGVGAYVTDQPGASAAVLPSRVVTVADEASEAPAGGSR